MWPDQAIAHLQNKQHQLRRKEAQAIVDDLESWPGIVQGRSEFQLPEILQEPVAEFPLYTDGLQCQLDPTRCKYICRGRETIRWHWREKHGWSVRNTRGGSGARKNRAVQRRRGVGFREVHCQRFFAQGPHSRYVEVCPPETRPVEEEHPGGSIESTLNRAWVRANEVFDEIQAKTTIAEGEKDEVNPWLGRAGWAKYLGGLNRE